MADEYVVEESDSTMFNTVTTTYSTTMTSIPLVGADPGYHAYRVKAVNSVGDSDWSNVETVGVAPGQPTLNPIVNAGDPDAYVVSWPAEAGATSYILIEGADPSYATKIFRYVGPSTVYTATGQAAGDWYYKVKAINKVGAGIASNSVMTTVNTAPLPFPLMLNINNADLDGDFKIRWNSVPTATLYVLEQSNNSFFNDPEVLYTGSSLEFDVVGRSTGIWFYRVRAYNATDYSSWSNVRDVTVEGDVFLPLSLRDMDTGGLSRQQQRY